MAFRAEQGERRSDKRIAFDPESGWELFDTWRFTGSNYENFELRHPTEPTIDFWGSTLSRELTGGVAENGVPIRRWRFKVHAVNHFAVPKNKAHKKLIREALASLGRSPEGYVLSHVEVGFQIE